jgi:hypothetical protein
MSRGKTHVDTSVEAERSNGRFKGQVYVSSMAAPRQQVPGSGTKVGQRAIVSLVRDSMLGRLRTSLRRRPLRHL